MSPGTAAAHNHPDAADPLDDAMAPPEPGRFWGRVQSIETFEIGFKKGDDGKYERPTPYNPDYHDFASKQIKFILAPLDATRPLKEIEMGISNRKNPEFYKIVQPSIFALGEKICQLRGVPIDGANFFRLLIDLFVFGEYVRRPWNKDDDDWTTLEFRDVFATQQECTAHQAEYQPPKEEPLPFPGDEPGQPAQATAPDPVRASLAAFLKPLWDASAQNAATFHTMIAANPMLAQHFEPTSPEVIALTGDMPV
ncbi:MAG: hypothetical protein ACW99U_21810 [Candidatus Thorarchaeota archaeon]|jgi:hypothetical protein